MSSQTEARPGYDAMTLRNKKTLDVLNLDTPRLQKADRSKSEPVIFPPIDGMKTSRSFASSQDLDGKPKKIKLPTPANNKYHLYSSQNSLDNVSPSRASKHKENAHIYNVSRTPSRNEKKDNVHRRPRNGQTRKLAEPNRKRRQEPHISFSSKVKETDGSLSIRKKIEHYRQWHEEQYKDKIRELKKEAEREKNKEEAKLASVYKDNKTPDSNNKSTLKLSHSNNNESQLPRITNEYARDLEDLYEEPVDVTQREKSARTWRTWRDVNESYAYTDVKTYIRENELMDDEKERHIEEWVREVDKARSHGDDGKASKDEDDTLVPVVAEDTLSTGTSSL